MKLVIQNVNKTASFKIYNMKTRRLRGKVAFLCASALRGGAWLPLPSAASPSPRPVFHTASLASPRVALARRRGRAGTGTGASHLRAAFASPLPPPAPVLSA